MMKTVSIVADGASSSAIIDESSTSDGDCLVIVTATTWGVSTSGTLEASVDGATRWFEVKESGVAVTFAENGSVIVPSDLYYRLTVTSLTGSTGLTLVLKSN